MTPSPTHEATHLTPSDWGELQHTVRHHVLRYFHRHGLLERHVTEDMPTWKASGGLSIDASVAIPLWDRAGLERLLRYRARPPFAETARPFFLTDLYRDGCSFEVRRSSFR